MVCGDGSQEIFDYRRHTDLDNFFRLIGGITGVDPQVAEESGGRYNRACTFVSACNEIEIGQSGLPIGIEELITAVLNLGEFRDTSQREKAIELVRPIFDGYAVEVEVDLDGEARLRSTATDRRQAMIDEELHTTLGAVLRESDLDAARVHYTNARRLLKAEDYANAAKEAVCSVESCLQALTETSSMRDALRKAVEAGVPRPLDGLIEKLYAWRGNEPGVAHGGSAAPAVGREDAEFALNQAGVVNLYLRKKLLSDS